MTPFSPAPLKIPVAELRPGDEVLPRISLSMRVINLIAVIVPFLGLLAAIVLLWGWAFSWMELGLLLGMYVLTVLGITVGFHRLFTHRAFETNGVVQFLLAALGSMAAEGPLLKWVAFHRLHHQHSDQAEDPHSPNYHGQGLVGLLYGLYHAHIGWFFQPDPPNLARYVPDLRQSAPLRVVSAPFPLWVVVGLLVPAILGWVLMGNWLGALFGLLWGGLARMFLVHHVTWCINSVCHLWGSRPFRSHDLSRNNFLFGILALGEGWHNNHHAFPTSARHGWRWWQMDVSYWVIRGLALVRLAWNVRLPGQRTRTA